MKKSIAIFVCLCTGLTLKAMIKIEHELTVFEQCNFYVVYKFPSTKQSITQYLEFFSRKLTNFYDYNEEAQNLYSLNRTTCLCTPFMLINPTQIMEHLPIKKLIKHTEFEKIKEFFYILRNSFYTYYTPVSYSENLKHKHKLIHKINKHDGKADKCKKTRCKTVKKRIEDLNLFREKFPKWKELRDYVYSLEETLKYKMALILAQKKNELLKNGNHFCDHNQK